MLSLFLALCGCTFIMGLLGNVWARYDAREIYWRDDTGDKRSLNHKSRWVLRLSGAVTCAALPLLSEWSWMQFPGLLLFCLSILYLVFVPVLNKMRKKPKHYTSTSNHYDSFFIRHWQGRAGKVAYTLQIIVLIISVGWIVFAAAMG